MNRGVHTRPNCGASIDWLTPPHVLEALGPFDTDPCAHPEQPWRTAAWMIAPPADGLAWPWSGRTFVNPPYGQNHLWLRKLAEHGDGIALVAARTEVEKWFVPYVWEAADALLFLYGRLYYLRPDGKRGKGNAGHGSVLCAYGKGNAEALKRSGLRGRLVAVKGA